METVSVYRLTQSLLPYQISTSPIPRAETTQHSDHAVRSQGLLNNITIAIEVTITQMYLSYYKS